MEGGGEEEEEAWPEHNGERLPVAARSPPAVSVALLKRLQAVVRRACADSPEPWLLTAETARRARADDKFVRLDREVRDLRHLSLEKLTHGETLAYFLNVYNLLALYSAVVGGPPSSLRARVRLLTGTQYHVAAGMEAVSLADIEHEVLRAPSARPESFISGFLPKYRPQQQPAAEGSGARAGAAAAASTPARHAIRRKEPLVTFALACGAVSAPRARPYTGDGVARELAEAARDYLDRHVETDPLRGRVLLPRVLSWFRADFAPSLPQLLDWVLPLLGPAKRGAVQRVLLARAAAGSTPHVAFKPYDWHFFAVGHAPRAERLEFMERLEAEARDGGMVGKRVAVVYRAARDRLAGLHVRSRKRYLKSLFSCFSGADFVRWAIDRRRVVAREDAVAIGQRLLDLGAVHGGFRGSGEFQNSSSTFYCFETAAESWRELRAAHEALAACAAQGRLRQDGHPYRSRKHPNSFTGSELVELLTGGDGGPLPAVLACRSREEALELGHRLVEVGLLRRVSPASKRSAPYAPTKSGGGGGGARSSQGSDAGSDASGGSGIARTRSAALFPGSLAVPADSDDEADEIDEDADEEEQRSVAGDEGGSHLFADDYAAYEFGHLVAVQEWDTWGPPAAGRSPSPAAGAAVAVSGSRSETEVSMSSLSEDDEDDDEDDGGGGEEEEEKKSEEEDGAQQQLVGEEEKREENEWVEVEAEQAGEKVLPAARKKDRQRRRERLAAKAVAAPASASPPPVLHVARRGGQGSGKVVLPAGATEEQIEAVSRTVGRGGALSRLLVDNSDSPVLWFAFGALSMVLRPALVGVPSHWAALCVFLAVGALSMFLRRRSRRREEKAAAERLEAARKRRRARPAGSGRRLVTAEEFRQRPRPAALAATKAAAVEPPGCAAVERGGSDDVEAKEEKAEEAEEEEEEEEVVMERGENDDGLRRRVGSPDPEPDPAGVEPCPLMVRNVSSRDRPVSLRLHEVVDFEGELFSGRASLKVQMPDADAMPADVAAYFARHPRKRWEVMVQGKFKRVPSGTVYLGAELSGNVITSGFKGLMCKMMVKVATTFHSTLHQSTSDWPRQHSHMCIPLMDAADAVVVTPEGEEPPPFGVEAWEDARPKKGSKRGAVPIDDTSTYSVVFFSRNIDLATWTLVDVPGLNGVDLLAYWRASPITLCAYELDDDGAGARGKGGRTPHTADLKSYAFAFEVQHERSAAAAAAAAVAADAAAAAAANGKKNR